MKHYTIGLLRGQENGPTFNGETLRFSLLLAPYSGDEPPQQIQNGAAAHFYTPGVIVHSALPEMNAVTAGDIERFIDAEKRRLALLANTPLSSPGAFLANPSAGAVDLVWDAPHDEPVTGYEIQWRTTDLDWQSLKVDPLTRGHMDGLKDGTSMKFRIRSLRGEKYSAWTKERSCISGAVTETSLTAMLETIPLVTLAKVIGLSLWSLLRAKFHKE